MALIQTARALVGARQENVALADRIRIAMVTGAVRVGSVDRVGRIRIAKKAAVRAGSAVLADRIRTAKAMDAVHQENAVLADRILIAKWAVARVANAGRVDRIRTAKVDAVAAGGVATRGNATRVCRQASGRLAGTVGT